MHITLPESTARRQRSPGGVLLSAALHAAIIGGTVVATGMSAPRTSVAVRPPEALIFVKADPRVPRAQQRPARVSPRVRPATPLGPSTAVLPVVPSIVSTVVPTIIPAIDMSLAVAFDTASSARPATGRPSPSSGGASAEGTPGRSAPLTALAVDREVIPRSGVTPAYPALLVSAGIEGTVVARFVVDTLGRVEPASIDLLSATHPLFERSVRDALARMRFEPAESRGHRVRQLVQQSFAFALSNR